MDWDDIRCSDKDYNLQKLYSLKSQNQETEWNEETGEEFEEIKWKKKFWNKMKEINWNVVTWTAGNGQNLSELVLIEIARFHFLSWN